jgi:hypothetical protein
MSQAHLIALGQQGNTNHEQLLEMQAAQQGMKEVAQKFQRLISIQAGILTQEKQESRT